MKTETTPIKTPFSIKLIYWIVNAMFWVLILGIIAQIGDQLLYFFNFTENPHYTFSMPLKRDLLPISEVEVNGTNTPVKVVSILGGFNVWNLDFTFAVIRTTTFYLNAFLFIYALNFIKNMLKNVKKNSVFTFENVLLLKRAAYIFFIIWIIKDVLMQSYVQINYTYFNPFNNLFMDYLLSAYLLIASIVLAIAYIFEAGLTLQHEQNLTI